jgi:hypothetical protein
MNESTTSIMELPTDPTGGGSISNNISMSATEQNTVVGSLDPGTISQLVNGLQQATIAGSTQLPSRDIPMTTTGHNTDPQIHPNYIPSPPPNNIDYIKDYDSPEDTIDQYAKQTQINNSLDEMYNEMQIPLLLAVLYFLFQLPFFRKFLFSYIPILFSNDGNYNLNGYLFCSVLFGLFFYLLNKLTIYFA